MSEQDGIHWHVYLQECLAESLAGDLAHRHVERLVLEIKRLRAELDQAKSTCKKLMNPENEKHFAGLYAEAENENVRLRAELAAEEQ